MDGVAELRKALKEDKMVFGVDQTLKGLRKGEIAQIFLSSTVKPAAQDSIVQYAGASGAAVFELDMASDALGVFCKKPFSLSVLSVLK